MRIFLAAVIFFSAFHGAAIAAGMDVLNPSIRQGETFIVKFGEAPKSVVFDGKQFAAFPYQKSWRAVVPVPLSAKAGSRRLTAELANGQLTERSVSVSKRISKVVVVSPPPKLGLTSKEIVQNLDSTNKTARKAVEEVRDATLFSQPFGLPLANNRIISTYFGEVVKTGDESIPHLGTDLAVPRGSIIGAINAGIVKSAYFDTINGNSVIIDHGRGIYSLYLHLNEMKVKEGDAVGRGTLVGTVGDTGFASGPHLHLSIKINGVSVDPVRFVGAFR